MKWLFSLMRSLFCRHSHCTFVRNIWGDEINFAGGKRSLWRCNHCGWLLAKDVLHRGDDGEYVPMTFAWRRIDDNNYRLDDRTAVHLDWATGRWHVMRDGAYDREDYKDAGAAIEAAERGKA